MTHLQRKVALAVSSLGGTPDLITSRGLPHYDDARRLVVADVSRSGFEHRLAPVAANRWKSMKASARGEGLALILLSGFRSFERQFGILQRRIEAGEPIDELFRVLAPPGCSQHHTGRALDIGTPGCEPASPAFAGTPAFAWLERHAGRYGFTLSYPENNSYGYLYEPWHWYLTDSED